jgi:hypothetical protein
MARMREAALMESIAKSDAKVQCIAREIQEMESRARAWGRSLLPVQMQLNMKAKEQKLIDNYTRILERRGLWDAFEKHIYIQDAQRAEYIKGVPRLKKALLPLNPLAIEPRDDGGVLNTRTTSPNM